jgi:hypothetical protein
MKAAPVRRHRRPAYPTKLEAQSDPSLLRKNVPPAWRAVPELAGAVALFVALETAGCRPGGKSPVVAPLFEHGEGRGSTGCVAVAPPVFLSEEEAIQVIREEASRQGLTLSRQPWQVPGAQFADGPASVDAVDLEKKVAVKFISETAHRDLARAKRDERFLAPLRGLSLSSVHPYDLPEMGRYFAARVRRQGQGKIYLGTLYDPAIRLKPDRQEPNWKGMTAEEAEAAWQKPRNEARAEAKRLLRLQVQDFVKWLQAQGAI